MLRGQNENIRIGEKVYLEIKILLALPLSHVSIPKPEKYFLEIGPNSAEF